MGEVNDRCIDTRFRVSTGGCEKVAGDERYGAKSKAAGRAKAEVVGLEFRELERYREVVDSGEEGSNEFEA